MNTENFNVREAEGLRPRLREGLHFSLREERSGPVCLIEDTSGARYHRVGVVEYRFLRGLDGTRTVATVLAQLARAGGTDALTEHEALQVIDWARGQHLLSLDSGRGGNSRAHDEQVMRTAATWLNPLIVRIPLGRPDAFFARVAPRLGWALGLAGLAVWVIVLFVGAAHLATEWPRFTRGFDGMLARDNWLWLFVAFAGLKVAHEFAHGLWCRHFGAPVREIGVMLILGLPLGYVDATASIGLASKWRRIMVSVAGMWMEFFIAAIAAIVWAHAGSGQLENFAHNVVFAGTAVTLFFNANPLMRFDGYFILADLLEVPNLATRGRQWVQRALSWLAIGARDLKPALPRSRELWIVAIYGVAAWLWQFIVLASLIAGATSLLRGGGLLLAAMAIVAWVALPLWQFATRLAQSARGHSGALIVRAMIVAGLCVAVGMARFHRTVAAAGVVEFADTQMLRVECPGFVEEVLVEDGATVVAGQVLMRLRNPEAESALVRARLALEQEELRARVAYTREDVATFQAQEAKVASRRETVAQNESYVGTLTIRAPFAGRIAARRLAQLSGSFLQKGEEALRIGAAGASDVKVAVTQDQEPHLRGAVNAAVRVKVAGRAGSLPGTLTRMEARAGREIALPALSALAGGPLAVRRAEQQRPGEPGYELVEPHFLATVRIGGEQTLLPGETARVKLTSARSVTPWSEFQRMFARWWRRAAGRRGDGTG
ncbi:MAG: HlyD family efflux transporter periplasmic adaptor subunit [Chthoniobacteraceae bacterium]